jgi:hypothetical protein
MEMNKFASLSLVALATAATTLLPAQASDGNDIMNRAAKVPVMVTSLFAGMAIGTPVAVVHDTMNDVSSARDSIAAQFGGQDPDACQYFVADLAALPAGLATGLVNGTYHGITNAVNNCSEKPFSAESFCLKDSCYEDTH